MRPLRLFCTAALALGSVAGVSPAATSTAEARDPGTARTIATATPGISATLPAVAVDCRGAAEGDEIDPEQLTPRAHEPVLLVHGTTVRGDENYRWALAEHLYAAGFNACWFDYPSRGMVDQQTSGEVTAAAILRLRDATAGFPSAGQIDVLGHSQGAVLPRWAVRWFPDARATVDDMVLLAGPAHGTTAGRLHGLVPGAHCSRAFGNCPESVWQFDPDSAFVEALNRGGDTFEDIDYTNLYTAFDELVRHGIGSADPRGEVERAASLGDADPATANVRNVYMQDPCPGRPVDHLGIFIDHVMALIAVDAFATSGPSSRSIGPADCAVPFFSGSSAPVAARVTTEGVGAGMPDWHRASQEPPLRPYAQP